MTYSFLEVLIFFWLNLIDIFIVWSLFLTTSKILYVNINSKSNQLWKKTLLVSDIDVEKSCFVSSRVKTPYQQLLIFLTLMNNFLKGK